MLHSAFTFPVLALIAAVLGFGGIAALSVDIARVLFPAFIVLLLIAAVMHAMQGKTPSARPRRYRFCHNLSPVTPQGE